MASDATAFGFLSALAVLLAWYLYSHYNEKWLGLLFAALSLIGNLNSVTRIGFFTIVVAIFLFIFFSRIKIIPIFIIVILFLGSLIFNSHLINRPGTNLIKELKANFISIKKSLQLKEIKDVPLLNAADPRNILWYYSWKCFRSFPITGIGTGNFVFWVMATHKGKFLHHLPANQYFFITASTGLIGLLVFILFCFGLFRCKKWPEKWLLGTFLFLLIFNDYLWFSEIFLVFWLFCSLGENSEKKPPVLKKYASVFYVGIFLVFLLFNLLNLSDLHPKTWAREASTPYDYGFSYPEKESNRSFRWTGAEAGFYVYLNKSSPRVLYKLICSAPLPSLNGQQQAVDVYWRGRFYQRVIFHENGEYSLWVEDAQHREGFLEFRVHPAFNLKKLGLGPESRELGVQVSGPGI